MLRLAPLRHQEAIAEPLHDLALASGFGQNAAGFEEGIGRPCEALLSGHDGSLRGGNGEDGTLQLTAVGRPALQIGQPMQLLSGPLLRGFDQGHGTLVSVEGMAQFDARGLLAHLAKAEHDAKTEAVAHHWLSVRNIDAEEPAGRAGGNC